jgi:hypothetical protein
LGKSAGVVKWGLSGEARHTPKKEKIAKKSLPNSDFHEARGFSENAIFS